MELTDKVIILKSEDNKEKNKKLTLIGLNEGIFVVYARGVKGEKAKLKFLNLPFVFCDLEFVKNQNSCVVKTASLIESFGDISKNYDKLQNACLCTEILLLVCEKGVADENLFALFLATLEKIAKEDLEEHTAIKFILKLLQFNGYQLSFEKCNNCNKTKCENYYVNFSTGEFLCVNCADEKCQQVKNSTIDAFRKIENESEEKISAQSLKSCRLFLSHIFECVYGKKPKLL